MRGDLIRRKNQLTELGVHMEVVEKCWPLVGYFCRKSGTGGEKSVQLDRRLIWMKSIYAGRQLKQINSRKYLHYRQCFWDSILQSFELWLLTTCTDRFVWSVITIMKQNYFFFFFFFFFYMHGTRRVTQRLTASNEIRPMKLAWLVHFRRGWS